MENASDLFGGPEAEHTSGVRPRRWRWILAVLVVVLVGAGGGAWYLLTPHNAQQQFAQAEKLRQKMLAGSDLSAAERDSLRQKTLESYQRVFTKFDPGSPEAPQAHQQLAELESLAGHPQAARDWWQKLIDHYPTSPQAHEAYRRLAQSCRDDGRALLATKRAEGLKLLEQAVKALEDYASRYGASDPQTNELTLERCRILQDDIADPPSRALEALRKLIEQVPPSPIMDEALLRLGRVYEQIGEYAAALEQYRKLIEQYPHSAFLKKAELGRARSLSKIDPEAAEKLWKELATKYADDPELSQQARKEADDLHQQIEAKAQQARDKQAQQEDKDYRSSRYGGGGGGGGPLDTGWGKPIPPQEMLRDFIAQNLNAIHYNLQLRIEPAAHAMRVTGTMNVVNDGDDKKDFLLMLGPLMQHIEMTFDGQPVACERPAGKAEVLHVKLDSDWKKGQKATLGFKYDATVNKLEIPKEIAEQAIDQLGRAPARGAWGQAAWLADQTPSTETSSTQPTTSQPKPSAGGLLSDPRLQLQVNDTGFALSGAAWYPVTIFGDLFTAEIAIEMVGTQEVVCTGRLADQGNAGEARTTRWVCEKQVFGLYFTYGPYKVLTREVNGLKLSAYFLPDQSSKAPGYLDAAEKVLAFYTARFGPYPFEKLSIAQVDLPPILGGVGPAGMIFLHTLAVQKKADVPVSLIAHELSHQWWGNQVPINLIDSNYSQWLSEGFATYSDALYTESAQGVDAFRQHIRQLGKLYLDQSADVREEPLIKTFMGQSPLYRVVVYEKGALVLHALRFVLGDETFFKVLREYAATYAFKRSTVDDFRKLASRVAGKDLDWFFSEWLDIPGCPHFVLGSVSVAPNGEGGGQTLTILITQPEQLSHMPLDVLAEGADGKSQRLRTTLSKKENLVTLKTDFPVRRVVLDPDSWVLHRANGDDTWDAPPAK